MIAYNKTGESRSIAMSQIEVLVSWVGGGAELLQWVDDDEVIFPTSRAVFRAGRSPISFTYEGKPPGEGRLFEWILLFPELTATDLKAQVRFDAGPWHSLSKAKEKKHSWTDFGAAP